VEHFDVIVVGAGLSGIGAAYHLQTRCPDKSLVILEARDAIGGTWDLFRYPGVRSDSDMFTLGYAFKPWTGERGIADGASILSYVREAAREHGIDRKIRFGHKLVRASWSSETALWTVTVERAGAEPQRLTCCFLYMCSGYFDYGAGYTPELAGIERFRGAVVHPQQWSDGVDYDGKRVVVIGSGATAMTLVPALARKAAHVVMLQRSPTYVVSAPSLDRMAAALRRKLPAKLAYALIRWRNVLFGLLFFLLARKLPAATKRSLVRNVRAQLGPGYDVDQHFTPRYGVWDQRVCLVPDGDLFQAIRDGRVSVVTDHIDAFGEHGVRLRSGRELEADLIVTATGLSLSFLGGAELDVDGQRVEPGRSMSYKSALLSDVPNMAWVFGYSNASWTLKADLTAIYICRLLRHMDAIGAKQCTPRRPRVPQAELPWLDFSSGYIARALELFPKQGARGPWRRNQNYLLDLLELRLRGVGDSALEFKSPSAQRAPEVVTGTALRTPSR
jgi:cation diffusion facilitator CzcD-associated flavoprotein CzcO